MEKVYALNDDIMISLPQRANHMKKGVKHITNEECKKMKKEVRKILK